MIFVTEELYGCACCNRKEKVIVLYPYYDTSLAPYCASCFVNKMRLVLEGYSRAINANIVEMQYRNAEKMNSFNVSIGYDVYKSVLADNDNLRDYIKELKKTTELWKEKYLKEKMDHTSTSARIVYAKHILSGNRDENVIEHMDRSKS